MQALLSVEQVRVLLLGQQSLMELRLLRIVRLLFSGMRHTTALTDKPQEHVLMEFSLGTLHTPTQAV